MIRASVVATLCAVLLLASCAYGTSMNCQFANISWAAIANHYTCTGDVIFSGNDGSILEVTGDHILGLTHDDVTGLSVYNQRDLVELPLNFDSFFPNLLAFDWVFGDLATVLAADFSSMPSLEILNLYGNQLVTLNANVFQNTPNLQYIDLGSNLIVEVGFGIFDSLTDLRWVLFQRNPCLDMIAGTPEALADLVIYLQEQCAPPGGQCPAACVSRIVDLEARVLALESALTRVIHQ